jgi:hypothetical protein
MMSIGRSSRRENLRRAAIILTAAGPDVVREAGPDQEAGLDTRDTSAIPTGRSASAEMFPLPHSPYFIPSMLQGSAAVPVLRAIIFSRRCRIRSRPSG